MSAHQNPDQDRAVLADLLSKVKDETVRCHVCGTMDRWERATGAAYCCYLQRWLPVCKTHEDELGDYGPEGCS